MPILQVGDHIRFRQPEDSRKSANVTFEVLSMPLQVNNGQTWWEMRGDSDQLVYIFTMLTVFSIEP